MRWTIIRIIWLRELRDQLRDRRTLLMIAGLPLLLYPILGFVVLTFAAGFAERKPVLGIVSGRELDFPPYGQPSSTAAVSWITLTPGPPGGVLGLDRLIGTAALAEAARAVNANVTGSSPLPPLAWLSAGPGLPGLLGPDRLAGAAALASYSQIGIDYPQLARNGNLVSLYLSRPQGKSMTPATPLRFEVKWLDRPRRDLLLDKKIDVQLSSSPDFWAALEHGQPAITVEWRDNDETSRMAAQRLSFVLTRWKKHIKEVRFVRHQLPIQFDDPFMILEPDADSLPAGSRTLLDMVNRIFPFMLVMWSLAGALYPAVDLCAGEKERGTMETLLITPASREEIVWGKFLTIWLFSAGTAFLNIISMGLTTWAFASQLPRAEISAVGMFWCLALLLPLSAFFSAICLAIGAYARSTKEGQYYLMPLFLVTMPLIFLTLAPGVELNPFYSMVPVTGVALLMQRFLTSTVERPWFYLVSVMAPIALYSWLALRWAIDQFQREEVLFREAERIDLHLWLRRLFREKETRPSIGQALFCFALLLVLGWLSEGLGQGIGLLPRSSIIVAAFLAAPPIFMAVLLTTRPRQVLATHWPAWPYLAAAILLVPAIEVLVSLTKSFPRLWQLLLEQQSWVEQEFAADIEPHWNRVFSIVLLAVVTAAGKEVAFRGFIFAGLLKRMQPWPAILVSSFLFAAFHMNVFLLPPLFILGVGLGVLALRSGSLLPGLILHGSGYSLLLLGTGGSTGGSIGIIGDLDDETRYALAGTSAFVAVSLLWWQNRRSGAGLLKALVAVPIPESGARSAEPSARS